MSSGTTKPGPSPEYVALLKGEITSEEYAQTVKRQIAEKQPLYKPRDLATQQLHVQAALSNLGEAVGKVFQRPTGYLFVLSGVGLALWSSYDGAVTTAVFLYSVSFGLLWLAIRHRRSIR
jgi:hypothetical protein